jgi:hypothetical protein
MYDFKMQRCWFFHFPNHLQTANVRTKPDIDAVTRKPYDRGSLSFKIYDFKKTLPSLFDMIYGGVSKNVESYNSNNKQSGRNLNYI